MNTIQIAQSQAEFNAVQQLHDEINVQELGKKFLKEKKRIVDAPPVVLFAEKDGKTVGSVTCTFSPWHTNMLLYWGYAQPSFDAKIGLSESFFVHKDFRNSRIAYELVIGIYVQALRQGSHITLIQSEPHLEKLYTKLGFKVYRRIETANGLRLQYYINPWDIDHLKEVRSPFYRAFKEHLGLLETF